jgi:glycine/D-amino acid oxidase-like deaminating enzyme
VTSEPAADARVVIVGGGVVGASLAWAFARAGLAPWVVDAGRPAASDVPVALLNPFRGRTGRAHPDDVLALRTTWRWADELGALGETPGAHRSGAVRVADSPKQARTFTAAGLVPVEPALAGVRAPHGAFLAVDGGWLEPSLWRGALRRAATRRGAHFVDGAAVVAAERVEAAARWRLRVEPEGGDTSGGTVTATLVLFATGAAAWPDGSIAGLGPTPAFEAVAGDVAVTRRPAPLRPLAGSTYVGAVRAPDAGSETGSTRLVAAIGGHHRPPGPAAADTADRLRAAIAWTLPDLAGSGAEDHVWSGVRAHPPGRRPVVRSLGTGALWVGGFAGRGFLTAAHVAEAVVASVSGEARPPLGDSLS